MELVHHLRISKPTTLKKKLKEEIPFKSIRFFNFEDSTEKTKKNDPVIP